MNIRYSISYLILMLAAIASLIMSIYSLNRSAHIEEDVELLEEIKVQTADMADVEAKNEISSEEVTEGFYLRTVNGYVVVYLFDNQTVFEKTTISASKLDLVLQEELKSGKYIETIQELYGFLENYSS